MSQPPPTLAYAPPRLLNVRRFLRWLLLAGVVATALWGGLTIYGTVRQRLALIEIQNRCLGFTAPADTIVYGENDDADAITATPPYTNTPNGSRSTGGTTTFRYRGRCFFWMNHLTSKPQSSGMNATLFAGPRNTPDGRAVIVGMQMETDRFGDWFGGGKIVGKTVAAKPIHFVGTGYWASVVTPWSLGAWPAEGTAVRFYGGQPDPTDASRFTIAYQIGDQPGVIEGVLNNDLAVTLTPRTGPLATPATTQESR